MFVFVFVFVSFRFVFRETVPKTAQVTPLELEVALGKREWDGFYSTDFDDVLALQNAPAPPSLPPPTDPDAGAFWSCLLYTSPSPRDRG